MPGSARWSPRHQPGWGAGCRGWCRWPRVKRAFRPPTPASRRGHRTENRRRMAKDAPRLFELPGGTPGRAGETPALPEAGRRCALSFQPMRDGLPFPRAARAWTGRVAPTRNAPTARCTPLPPKRMPLASLHSDEVPEIPENGCGLAKSGVRRKLRNPSRKSLEAPALTLKMIPVIPENACSVPSRFAPKCAILPETPDRQPGSRLRAEHRRSGALQGARSHADAAFTLKMIPIIPENTCCLGNSEAHESAQSFPKLPFDTRIALTREAPTERCAPRRGVPTRTLLLL